MRRSGAVGLVLGLCLAPLIAAAACGSEFQGSDDDTEASGGGAGDANGTGGSGAIGGSPLGGSDPGGNDQGGTTATGGVEQGGTTATGGNDQGGTTSGGTDQGGTTATGGMAGSPATGGVAGALATGGAAGTLGAAGAGSGGRAGASGNLSTDRLVYWFSADVGVDVVGGGVSRWNDRSMNQADAVQLSNAVRPTLATLGDSNLPAVVFDGEDDYLGLPPLTASFSQGVSFFAIARPTTSSTCSSLVQLSNGSEIDDISFDRQQDSLLYEVHSDYLFGQNGAFGIDETRLVEVIQAPDGAVNLWLNGVATGVGSFGLPVEIDRNQTFIGRNLYLNCTAFGGEISEIVLYARAVTNDERRAVEAYLEGKWQCCGS